MAKYLLLKHYRGAPAPVNDVPMSSGRRRSFRPTCSTWMTSPIRSHPRVLCHSPPNFLVPVKRKSNFAEDPFPDVG
jgi:hypothetical protein